MKVVRDPVNDIECYKSISELPIFNWYKCLEDDHRWVAKVQNIETLEHADIFDSTWGEIQTEFVDTFYSDSTSLLEPYKQLLNIRTNIVWLKWDLITEATDKKIKTTPLRVVKEDRNIPLLLEEAISNLKKTVAYYKEKEVNQVQDILSVEIDQKKMNVKEFYEQLNKSLT